MGSAVSHPSTPSPPANDLIVVGSGASGVAILLQLIERVKNGKSLGEVIFVERNGLPGPGLPYSSQCEGTILNMHTDTMGLYHDKPLHFSQWRTDQESGPFPSRARYGQYLQETWGQALEEAQHIGLGVSVIQDEAHNIDRQADGTMALSLRNGTQLRAKSVVLALGNFTSVCNTHLVNLPGFFPGPWPTSQLKTIPTDASVLVVGSRLSAVDAAIFLSEHGHQGPITFMSRSGSLPKVQGESTPFPRRYILHDLAKHIEENSEENLLQVTSSLMEEIFHATDGDWSWLHNDESPVKQLEHDIQAAKTGKVEWQKVLRGTAPVIERYWNGLPAKSQQLFMDKFFSPWMRYRHGMPIQNAEKILGLLKKGQLQVVQGDRVHWDGIYKAQTSIGLLEAPYVIEATGQECQLDRVESPLVQSAVEKGLLKPHPAGGVASTSTACVHQRACMSSGLLPEVPISTTLVPQLLAAGHTPFIFLPVHKANRKTTPPFELRELTFFEREILQKHVIPYFKNEKPSGAPHMTVEQMKDAYGILVQQVPNVNSATFINTLRKHHIDVGLSLRCYQRFKTDIIRYFARPKRLLNLHPGVFPLTIDEDWDAGDLIDVRHHPIDYSKSMLHFMNDVYKMGAKMAADVCDTIARGKELSNVPQKAEESNYYTFPTKEDLEGYRKDGIRLVDAESIVNVIVESFAPLERQEKFRAHIDEAVQEWMRIVGFSKMGTTALPRCRNACPAHHIRLVRRMIALNAGSAEIQIRPVNGLIYSVRI
ncbi:hypothetical protein AARAC_000475 [Aspergillus arachidicola]|uniref:FAD-dependent urate hydroxylase HpyO/Asp monooxygenase CreE-like FAD/NAD(P)-binding domain-containing protein n=1 Tax=Aspergillus arachidicola TaxID=656916 RepID=A0A2G7G748_9EURO|nr:hypothetical protein AARAC_000475 [Aspergillus arachidicola]